MFFVEEPHRPYSDPWGQPFSDRFRALCGGKPRVAYFYEAPDTSTFRYRAYNMVDAIKLLRPEVGAAYFFNSDAAHFARIVDNSDVIVLCRVRYNGQFNELVTRAKQQGKRVLFDVDDLVFDVDYTHLVLKTLDQDFSHPGVWDHWFAYMSRIGAALRMCDGAITTNSYLARKINDFSGLPVSVVPNFMNRMQLEVSDRVYGEKAGGGFKRNGEVHFGYFSGTPTHNHDFSMVANGLAAIMAEEPSARLLVVGFLDFKGGLEDFRERITVYPLHDFVNLQRLMSLVEVNMVPLLDNGFTNCKSELKYFEAAAVGTVTVATPIHTYAGAICDGDNGFLATSTQWKQKLRQAFDLVGDGYSSLADKARAHALEKHAWYNQIKAIEAALFACHCGTQPEGYRRKIALATT